MKIVSLWAREILDSRGNPTVEVDVITENGFGTAAAPSGASTGKHEAYELRDGGKRYGGKGVQKAVENINNIIAPALVGLDIYDQEDLDKKMRDLDGTRNKSKLGANAIVATSMALFKAACSSKGQMLYEYMGGQNVPLSMFNIINGGKHAGGKLAIQEFMIIPQAPLFAERLAMASEIYHILGKRLTTKYGLTSANIGDEGGFAPPIDNTYVALDELTNAIEEAGYEDTCALALDCAASSFYENGEYKIDEKKLNENQMIDYYLDLIKEYPIKSIEDPFHEESFKGFASLMREVKDVRIVGDDLTVTNPVRLAQAITEKSINTLLLKVNQVGTVSEALECVKMCIDSEVDVIVSHRSGETEDTFIADFAVGINAPFIKAGAPARGERTAKYNQLLRIEEDLLIKSITDEEMKNIEAVKKKENQK